MKNPFFERRCRYSIRKLSVGACSLMIGAVLFAGPALAEETAVPENSGAHTELVSGESEHPTNEADKQHEGEHARENKPEKAEGVATASETASPASNEAATTETAEAVSAAKPEEKASEVAAETPSAEAKPKSDKETEAKPEGTSQGDESKPAAEANKTEKEVQPDVPKNTEKTLKPKEIKFNSWEDLLKWEPGAREDDPINRSSVELAKRHRGQLVNEKASRRAKVQALANTNSKAKDHASVGGEEFKAYAFDYWQYLDSMVFWEGLVPTPDVIDAGHRNGVPVYGTLFFNWSNSIADQEKFAEALKQDEDGTFPIARKLVDLAKYYGFDGYFINQETTGDLVTPLGEKMRQFMLYTKEYAAKVNHPIKYAWYDAMTYKYGRYHEDGLGDYNYQFMQKEGDKVPADQFFANFNWNKEKNDHSVEMAKWLERSQYDVFAGLELQQGGSYKTKVKWDALLDEKGKLRLSLGLFAPDTITSLGKTGEDYHKNEDIFFTGYQGDPTAQKPADKEWYGIANLVADRTPAVGRTFTTSFNTGHGRKWFVDGKVFKDSEWNYRSVSGVLPTWRWWQTSTGEKLRAEYDFTDAYNGGNSLKFSGNVAGKTDQDVNLYSTKLEVTEKTKLRVAHKGGKGSKVYMAFSTTPDYKFDDADAWKELTLSDNWTNEEFDLSSLAGKTIYAVKLFFEHEGAVKDYQFNLGQLTISDNHQAPQAPTGLSVVKQSLKNAQEAEAVVQFAGNQDADFYEVYEKDGDNWRLLTGSSASTIYLPKVSRSANATGTTQELKVVAVGKNGLRSEAATTSFNWGMTVQDTTLPRPLAENIVPGATVIGSTFPNTEGGEGIEGMLNGTITSLSDKWSSGQLSGSVDIRLTQPRRVVRWVMDHAGAGGESVNDGLMNTKDFDLYYKDADGQWKLAKEVRGNKAHVTDITLDKPITAQDWRLHVITSDNGTPWKAIRIYNWKMYETLDTESQNIPMAKVAARSLGNHQVQLGFSDVPAGATITVYDKADSQTPVATLKTETGGDLATDPLGFDKQPTLLYYRTQLPGKEISNTLAVAIPQDERKIAAVSLEKGPKKTVYKEGEKLDLRGGTLRVQYEGGQADELINLTHSGVTVSGYDAHQKGEQNLTLQYLGLPVSGDLKVQVTGQDEGKPKEVASLYITKKPKTDYLVGDQLDLSEGRFGVLYDDETEETHSFTDEGIEITGYDAQKTGRQTLTLHYKGYTAEFDVLVSPKAAVNDEYLKQEITAAQGRQSTLAYTFSSEDKQAVLVEKLNTAKAVAENHDASQEEVNRALNELKQAGTDLDGNQRYQTAREELEGLLESVRKKDPKTELIEQAETLLASEMPTPQAFADMKEKMNKKLAPAEESHHVGSMDPSEAVPTVEALPELVVETETTAYERQERPNANLLKGQHQLVQKGEEGQIRRLVEIDAQGNRILRTTEILKESVPEITEVGTKVLSSNQPAEGVKDLVLETPKLEVEEIAVSFERQERPNSELLKGQRRIVQAGEEGQVRRLVEVDVQGKRTLRSSEVLKESVPEITEVGTKVLSSNQPAEGVKDLVLEIPKLEIEEDTVVFKHQERPNPNLPVGQRQLVQAGVEGQIRRLVEVDSQGNRTLRTTEVLKESVPEITEVGTKVLSSNQPAEGVKDLVLETPKLEVEKIAVSFERQERPNSELLKGQRRIVQAGEEGQIRRLIEVDSQGNRTLRTTEVLKEALPEIVEIGTKEEQDSQKTGQALLATPTNEKVGKELPNTGVTRDASLVALGLLGVMSGYGLLAGKKRENED